MGLEKPAPVSKPSREGPVLEKKRKREPIDDSLRRKSTRVKNIEEQKRYDEEEFEDEGSDESDEFLFNSDSESDGKPRRSKRRSRSGRSRRGRRGSLASFDGEVTEGDAVGLKRRIVNGRNVQHIDRKHVRPNGRVFGPIKGISVGKWWPTRLACSVDGVHPVRPPPFYSIMRSHSPYLSTRANKPYYSHPSAGFSALALLAPIPLPCQEAMKMT